MSFTSLVVACVSSRGAAGARAKDVVKNLGADDPSARARSLEALALRHGFERWWLPMGPNALSTTFDVSRASLDHEACATAMFREGDPSRVLAVPVRAEAIGEVARAFESEDGLGGGAVVFALCASSTAREARGREDGGGEGERRAREAAERTVRGDPGSGATWLFPPRALETASGGGGERASTTTIERARERLERLDVSTSPVKIDSYLDASTWTLDRVRAHADEDATADVHVCPHEVVDLAGHRAPGTRRNFEFRKMRFGEFLTRVDASASASTSTYAPVMEEGERYYLRSVDGKTATDLRRTHPDLARALDLPVIWPEDRFHSSVLRISSSNTTLWTHYDTHDNLLAQVVGAKTVTLFPPDAEPYMYAQGSSSRVENVTSDPSDEDYAKFPLFYDHARASGISVTLRAGDALYIPAFWFHHVVSADEGTPSVAVNVFWRSLDDKRAYDAKDIYGNKDMCAGKEACELAIRAGDALRAVPEPYKSFYARRAVKMFANQVGVRVTPSC